jgi:hypothetical protein
MTALLNTDYNAQLNAYVDVFKQFELTLILSVYIFFVRIYDCSVLVVNILTRFARKKVSFL